MTQNDTSRYGFAAAGTSKIEQVVSLPGRRSATAVVTDFFDALVAGDTDRVVGLVSADAVWSIPGDPELLPWVGEHCGRIAIRTFYDILGAETETQFLELGPIVGHSESVFVRGEFAYRFPRHGGHYSGAFVIVFTVRGGLIERYEMHEDSLGLARAFQNES